MLLLANGCQSERAPATQEVKRVDVEAFSQLTERGGVVLLDVRTPTEFASGHIPGARNIDIQSPSFASEIKALDPDSTYLVYCRSGHRSQRACEMMSTDGFSRLYELAPGFNGWKAEGKPVE